MADAHGSGPCDSNIVRVQVPFPAVNCIYTVRGSAGIGRQARLRILCLYRRVGSSPIFRINLLRKSLEFSRLFSFVLMKFFVTLCYTTFGLKTLANTATKIESTEKGTCDFYKFRCRCDRIYEYFVLQFYKGGIRSISKMFEN